MFEALVIGYGNTLRGDDGIGPEVAAAVEALALPGVRAVFVTQLMPELAAEFAESRLVVFVDATVSGEGVSVFPLSADADAPALSHAADPRALLALARAVYGRAPEGWLVTVTGEDFGVRDGLTELGRERARAAAVRVRQLLHSCRGEIERRT